MDRAFQGVVAVTGDDRGANYDAFDSYWRCSRSSGEYKNCGFENDFRTMQQSPNNLTGQSLILYKFFFQSAEVFIQSSVFDIFLCNIITPNISIYIHIYTPGISIYITYIYISGIINHSLE